MRTFPLRLQSYQVSDVLFGCFRSRTVMFSSSSGLRGRKKSSQYRDVDSERYASLVKAVVSTKFSAEIQESTENEDQRIHGFPEKSKTRVCRALKTQWPLLNDKKCVESDNEIRTMTRKNLEKVSELVSVPSVTKILQTTMSEQQAFHLERWKQKKISELGVEGFREYRSNVLTQGKCFHVAVEQILTGEKSLHENEEGLKNVSGYLKSLRHVLNEVTGVNAIESVVQHQPLQYLGIVDCVATYKDSLCVIEWKTSEKPKPFLYNTYDNPLQVAAYIGALNNDKNYNYQVDSGLIVVAYSDGSPAHPHFLNVDQVMLYWDKWLVRLEKYMDNVIHGKQCL